MKQHSKIFLLVGAIASLLLFAILYFPVLTQAFNGPGSNSGGSGSGAISVGGANNIAVGTTTTQANTEVLIVGSSTADTGNYSLQVWDKVKNPLLLIRNDGSVAIGTSSFSGGNILTVNGTVYATNGLTGTISAGNVTAGVFASGNFSFPGSLGVNTSTQVSLPSTLSDYGSFLATGAATLNSTLTQSGGVVSLASTTVNGNVTSTNITVSSLTSALALAGANGAFSEYGGASACAAGQAVTTISVVGATTCAVFSTVSTSTANSWTATQTFTSGISQSGAVVALASTTITGMATTTNLAITSAVQTVSFGAVALTVGTCTSTAVTLTGATTTVGSVQASPLTYPGDATYWKAYVSAANTVTVKLCAVSSLTPTASKYNVIYIY